MSFSPLGSTASFVDSDRAVAGLQGYIGPDERTYQLRNIPLAADSPPAVTGIFTLLKLCTTDSGLLWKRHPPCFVIQGLLPRGRIR